MRLIISTLFIAILFCGNLQAETNGLPDSDFDVHFSGKEFYLEQWSLSLWSENGLYVHVQFVISNVGFGDGKGAVKVEITAPGEKRFSTKVGIDKNWRVSSESDSLHFGDSKLNWKDKTWKLFAGDEKISVSLDLTPIAAGFSPGKKGHWYEGGGGSYDIVLLAPRLHGKGVLTMHGKRFAIDGHGMLDHSWTTMRPDKLAKLWLKFKFFSDDAVALFTGFTTPGAKKDVDRAWLWVMDDSGVVIRTTDLDVHFNYGFEDKKSEAKYKLPALIEIKAKDRLGAGGEIRLKTKKLLRRKEFLKELSMLERTAVSLVSEPIDYTFNADFEFRIKRADKSLLTVDENRDFVMHYINP